MCGVAGIFHLDGATASKQSLQQMTQAIAHRGPDGEGHWASGPVALGHRRLAILDLSKAGQQPMLSDDGRKVISYNGEIYNFRQLREELEVLGHTFHSNTDTEVVLKSYDEWGLEAVLRFNGMFAFALWDEDLQNLFLVRDRYGIKPLYYVQAGDTFLFGSEIKAILAHPQANVTMDKEALLEYMTFQNFFTDKTLFEGIKILPPATIATISPSGYNATTYWDYTFAEPQERVDEQQYLEELDRLFRQAVQRQLVSDVEVGAYLSGGMDSGSITATAAKELPYIKSFTVGFDLSSASGVELAFDERKLAEHMSYVYKTEHYEMVLKAGDMERAIPRLTHHLEEPRVGQSYPNFYAAQLASKFVKVCLGGAGGDELFAGYPWRYYRVALNGSFDEYIDSYYQFWQRLIPNSQIKEVFRPVWDEVSHVWTRDIFSQVFANHTTVPTTPEDYINHSLYFEAKTFLHGLLVMEDKLSMAHGLETRIPFLDNDLVDFAMKVPVHMKLGRLNQVDRINENVSCGKSNQYYQKYHDGKLILRRAMEKYIPEKIAKTEKQGFSAPDATWFKGESIDYVRRALCTGDAAIYQFFDKQAIGALIDEHLRGKVNRRLLIWSLLNLEQWCRSFL